MASLTKKTMGDLNMPPKEVLERLSKKFNFYTASNGRKFIIKRYRDKWFILWQNEAFPKWFWDQTQGSKVSYCPYIDFFTENRNPYLLTALCN